MRDDNNHKEKYQGYQITGFQSACLEFTENDLSLDERYDTGNPAIVQMVLSVDLPKWNLFKDDRLLIDRSMRPKFNDLVIIEGKVVKLSPMVDVSDREILGVVTTVFHHPNSKVN